VITIELRESVPYVAEQADNLLFVYFEASAIPPKPLEQAQLPAWQRVLSGTEREPAVAVSPRTKTGPHGARRQGGAGHCAAA
jgi:hypothetical protein